MSQNLARIYARIQLYKKSQNWTKIWMNSLVLSLKSAKIQESHPNFRICYRKSSPPPICSLDELLVIRSPKRIVKDPAKDNRIIG